MKVLVISGFLGAGKTTFIKKLIQTTQKYIVVLENEYGQSDLDAQEIERTGDAELTLLEFMEGCVCCTQKDKFSNTILTISAGIDPEYLVVEPTGVGKLSSILAAIEKVSYEKIQILKPIVILAPETYDLNMSQFGDIYKDQVANAGIVVFSKSENADPEMLARTAKKVRELNESAEIVQTHYSNMPEEWWNSLLCGEGEEFADIDDDHHHEHGHDHDHDESDMMQVSLSEGHLDNIGELVVLLEDTLRYEFGNIPRAKGVIKVGGEWMRFSLADRMYAITGEPETDETHTQCVFIGRSIDEARLTKRLKSYEDALSNALE